MKKNNDLVIKAAKASYYKTRLMDADSKTVYPTIIALLNKNQKILPSGDSNTALNNKFARFFLWRKTILYDPFSIPRKTTPQRWVMVFQLI